MSYSFWDYFWGGVIMSGFILPLLAVVVFKLGLILFFVLNLISGGGYQKSERTSVNVKLNSYDYDEDGY